MEKFNGSNRPPFTTNVLAVVGDRQNSPRVAATDEYQFKDLRLSLQTVGGTILKVAFKISE